MYKVISECNKNEVLGTGFFSKDKAQQRINEGYFHQYMYEQDKDKKLIVVAYADSEQSEQLVDFLLHLNDKELINNHDFDYEKEAKKYLKKLNNLS